MLNKPKTHQELEAMRQSGRMLSEVLRFLLPRTVPGIQSQELAELATQKLKSLGGKPAFLGVKSKPQDRPFPNVMCISINEEVQHGVPGPRVIQNGDIVNFDFGVRYQGLITDAGLTIGVGQISSEAEHLIKSTKKALEAGLKAVKAGVNVNDISAAIEAVLRAAKLGIVKELVGHGVGHHLHEEPEIPNYLRSASSYILQENQTIAIEPIATLGSGEIHLGDDGWTLFSADDSWAAHFEHTVRVTKSGCEILTPLETENLHFEN